jgi:hypothetical protein
VELGVALIVGVGWAVQLQNVVVGEMGGFQHRAHHPWTARLLRPRGPKGLLGTVMHHIDLVEDTTSCR